MKDLLVAALSLVIVALALVIFGFLAVTFWGVIIIVIAAGIFALAGLIIWEALCGKSGIFVRIKRKHGELTNPNRKHKFEL